MSTNTPSSKQMRLVGYFPSWGIHAQNYHVADIPAGQLSHVIYAFADVTAAGDCVSVSPDDDKVNFPQLQQLKQQQKTLRTLISVGGASHSTNFAAVAAVAAKRRRFAQSCVQFMTQNGFDGVDIDWEFPGSKDSKRFTALLEELQRQVDAQGAADGRHYLLTIAAPAGPAHFADIELSLIHPFLDWINLMSYDFHTASSPVTNFDAPLFAGSDSPTAAEDHALNVDAAVKSYLAAGVPADKIVLGLRFVATGWAGVGPDNNGLYQSATGPATGTWDAPGAKPSGSFGFQDIENNYLAAYTRDWHSEAQVPWLYNAATGIMISYEDAQSLTLKAEYVLFKKLGGVMIWELSADDGQHGLLNAVAAALGQVGEADAYTVSGTVTSSDGAGVGGLQVRLVDNFGDHQVFLGEATTDGYGRYSLTSVISAASLQARGELQPNFQVQVFVGQTLLAASQIITNPEHAVTIGVALPPPSSVSLSTLNLDQPVLATLTDTTADPTAKLALSCSLNAALKAQLASASTSAGYADLANLIQAMPFVDVVAVKDLSPHDFVSEEVTLPTDPTQKAVTEAAIAKLSTTTTIGDLLSLSAPINTNPILSSSAKLAGMATLLKTSDTLAPNAKLIDDFAVQYASFKGSLADFWNVLSQNDEFKSAVPELQLSLQLGTLTLANPPLVAALRTRYPQMTSPRSLTPLSVTDLQQLITSQNIPVPASISGATPAEKAANYASAIVGTLKQAFPGAYFAQDFQAAVASSTNALDAAAATFLSNAPDFDILSSNLTNYLAQKGDAVFQGIDATQRKAVTNRVATLQRVGKVAPDFATTNALLAAGFASAFDIARNSRGMFLKSFASMPATTISPADIYSKAQYIAAQAFTAHANMRQGQTSNLPRVIGSMQGDIANANLLPTWQTLFGSTSTCACNDCQSVYSAAAYMVNLLQFLKGSGKNSSNNTAYDALIARRPDIPRIKLNCVNTNTELPYVDLVNEILEGFIFINNGHLDASVARDTSKDATADQLSVAPEYTNDDAYNKYLNAVVYPLSLPYDRWLNTARTYLNFLGASLYNVMSACQSGANSADLAKGTPTGIALACECLNISEVECIILTGRDFSGTPKTLAPLWQYYGYANETVSGKTPNGNSWTISWIEDLAGWPPSTSPPSTSIGVENFIQRLSITYDDLVALLKTRALNPRLSISIDITGEACDVTQMRIIDRSNQRPYYLLKQAPTLDLMHRFIGLRNKLGWAISDLDKTMTGLQATDIDQQFLVSLAATVQLQATLISLPLLQILSFWSDLDTDGRDSLYLSLFQNKSVLNPPDAAFQLTYTAPLTAAPTLDFPCPRFPNLIYQPENSPLSQWPDAGNLGLETTISSDEYAQLQKASSDATFLAAIQNLQQGAPGSQTPLAALPAAALPAGLYDAGSVKYTGAMPDDYRACLNVSNDPAYQTAIDALYEMRSLWGVSVFGIPNSAISAHQPAILAALRISAQDLASIRTYSDLADPPQEPGVFGRKTPITLDNLSSLCRYVFLAQGLGLSISDLLTMIVLAGHDPFELKSPTQTLDFVQTVQAVQASQFSVAQLNYLYRHVYDTNANIAPTTASVNALLAGLQIGLAAIVAADQIVPDPKGDLLTKNLGILLGNSLASTAIGLITGTGVFSAPLLALPSIVLPSNSSATYNQSTQTLNVVGAMSLADEQSLLALSSDPDYQAAVAALYATSQAGGASTYSQPLTALPGIGFPPLPAGTIAYDAAARQLRFTGAMNSATQAALLALSTDPSYQAAITSLRNQPIDLINANFKVFLAPSDAVTQLIENPNALTSAQRIAYVTQRLMPYLQQVQCKSLVTQTLSDNLGLGSQLTGLLLNSLLKSQVSPANQGAVDDFLALVGDGLKANYFAGLDSTGTPVLTRIDATVDFNWGFDTPDPSVSSRPFSVEWSGFLIPQYSEVYTFYVTAGDGVRLSVNGQTLIDRWPGDPGWPPSGGPSPTEASWQLSTAFNAGQLYSIKLEYYDATAAGIIQLSWSSASTPKAIIPQTQLFSGAVIQSLDLIIRSYTLLFKSGLLISTLPLTYADATYFSDPKNSPNFANFDLNSLPLAPLAAGAHYSPVLFNQWQRLSALVNLRSAMPGGDAGLLNIFKIAADGVAAALAANPPQPMPQLSPSDPLTAAIAQATGWSATDIVYLAGSSAFGLTYADFVNEIGTSGVGLVQLQACAQLLMRLGVSAEQLITWSRFGPDPSNSQLIDAEQPIAADVQNTVKAKYDDATWVTVGKPLNDAIRQASTDALIAYILAGAAGSLPIASNWNMVAANDGGPITTADQLYEFFLIDVEMSTCMLTSRIVQANAAIQLFVQRCLLNLEYRSGSDAYSVSPAAIDTTIWAWMQNFRVWQAQAQVFYYPENWMVPTLRDDKTPFFEDLENALLQNPITTDTVEQAYLDYLSALDEVAQLDIRGTYWQLDPYSTVAPDGTTPDATNDVLHVFGRTFNKPYKYYYRRLLNCSYYGTLAGGATWTPWEEVGVDIQADHLVPVVWDGRLYLFWPSFAQSAEQANQTAIPIPSSGDNYNPPAPVMDLSITLNWSEFKQSMWTPKHSSDPLLFERFAETYGTTETFGVGSKEYCITNLGGSNIDASKFQFSSLPNADGSLPVNIYGWRWPEGNFFGFGKIGQFLFAGCGGNPSSTTNDDLLPPYPYRLLPVFPCGVQNPMTSMIYNSIWGSVPADDGIWVPGPPPVPTVPYSFVNGLQLWIGLCPPLVPVSNQIEPVAVSVLSNTPASAQPWSLMFPQQFLCSFAIMRPPPQIAVPDGRYQVLPGQPFFYQDNLRSYFVTEQFTVGLSAADANQESPIYGRSGLTATPRIASLDAVFPNAAASARLPSPSASSPVTADDTRGGGVGSKLAASLASPEAIPVQGPAGLSEIQFSTFFHPHACSFIEVVNRYGLANLLAITTQARTNDNSVASGNGVLSGFVMSSNGTAYPSLSPGLLIAQGQLYEATNVTRPQTPIPTAPGSTFYLFYTIAPTRDSENFPNTYYYNYNQTPLSPGDAFIGAVQSSGNDGQIALPISGATQFEANYQPNQALISPYAYPHENVDFSPTGAYSIYNWELFFHIPLLIATQLSANQQFQDAQTWFHYIFNPTTNSPDAIPQRYWNFLPFYECAPFDNLQGQWLLLLGLGPSLCGQGLPDQLAAAANKPFDPFAVARLRTIAFRMKVVMAYLDNLIAWGDNLFAQNTRESIAEATQLYVLAKEILGPRPIQISQPGPTRDYSYNDLVTLFGVDLLGNAIVLIENDLPYVSGAGASGNLELAALSMSSVIPYFCLPANDTLNGYWGTVDDRLYKIRHCMNIQGVVEQLPLFSPPISPALLVAAQAAGVDLSSVLSNVNAGTPFYRFRIMLQKALELCAEVRSFGAALLSALEKQDAEALSLMRATQETSLLQQMQQLKEYAVQEAQATYAGLQASLKAATDRQNYYMNLHAGELSDQENAQLSSLAQASTQNDLAATFYSQAQNDAVWPEFSIGINGFGGTPSIGASMGGSNLVSLDNAFAAAAQNQASKHSNASSQSGLLGGWGRRDDEWVFQAAQAGDEMAQISAQISAANFRIQIAQEDQKNLNTQIQNAQQVQDFLTGKYTNKQLYSWMVDQISTVYFQCYQMAYNLATQAEAAFRFERCLTTSNYIQFGYWDSLKKGLMAGERLYADIKRMELAYLQTDFREYEIRKSISLILLDPWALISLKETGQCVVNLPEALFDFDYPGQIFRRVKTVSLTIPSVLGPYTSVNCTLTLLNSKIRVDSGANSPQDYGSDAHFVTNYAATQSIATSTAQDDDGMFEVNFRDERYLPFEGAGSISTWQIDMPIDCNAFDFESISDVVINLSYTARYGGDQLRKWARQAAVMPPPPTQSPTQPQQFPPQPNLQRLFSLRHEYQSEWYKFLNPTDGAAPPTMQIPLDRARFPYQYRSAKSLKLQQAQVIVLFKDGQFGSAYGGGSAPLLLAIGPAGNTIPVTLPTTSSPACPAPGVLNNIAAISSQAQPAQPAAPSQGAPPSWTLSATSIPASLSPQAPPPAGVTGPRFNPDAIADILLLCQFAVQYV